MPKPAISKEILLQLKQKIIEWGKNLGFQQIGISDVDLTKHEPYLLQWLENNYHGDMAWMAQHGLMRSRPADLVPNTLRIISARMDYLPPHAGFAQTLQDPTLGYISRYALGRDYHKLIRQRLKKLGEKIEQEIGQLGFRPFVDSAPVLERPLAEKAGLGWVGKHSLLLNEHAGSWFFLGELFVDIPLEVDTQASSQCGRCVACKTSCPTGAIVEDKVVDARRCISYLTIELDGVIPEQFRQAIGNRIYGCDDCQLVCPFNRFAEITQEPDFHPRAQLFQQKLTDLFQWDEATFLKNTEGSAIRRIGYFKWQRNLTIALGNAPFDAEIINQLEMAHGKNDMLDIHIEWSLSQQRQKQQENSKISNSTQRLIRIVQKGLPRDA